MQPLKILIVEDEFIIASNLKMILEDLGYDPIEPSGSKKEAIQAIEQNDLDLVILDINLGGNSDGIEIGRYLKEKTNIPFLYLTSNADRTTIDEAKSTQPRAYLIKPFTEEDIYAAIEIAVGNEETQLPSISIKEKTNLLSNSIFIKVGNKFVKIKIDEITHIEADGKGVRVSTINKQKLQIKQSLESIHNQLEAFGFIRVQRGFLININHLTAINGEFVYIENQQIPIGRLYKEELLTRIRTMH